MRTEIILQETYEPPSHYPAFRRVVLTTPSRRTAHLPLRDEEAALADYVLLYGKPATDAEFEDAILAGHITPDGPMDAMSRHLFA